MSPGNIFRKKLAIFVASGNKNNNCMLIHNFCFFYFLKVVLLNANAVLIISAKLATPGIL